MRYYPVFLDLQDRPCLVIGHGQMADEKTALLEGAGAEVHRADRFDPEEAQDSFLIVAVLEDAEMAREVKDFGDRNRIFVNVVDQPENCSFIAPAIVDRGNLLIAISTSGKSPALASRIRCELEEHFGHEYSDLLDALAEIRPLVEERFDSFEDRKDFYARLVQMDLLEILRSEGLETVRARMKKELEGRNN